MNNSKRINPRARYAVQITAAILIAAGKVVTWFVPSQTAETLENQGVTSEIVAAVEESPQAIPIDAVVVTKAPVIHYQRIEPAQIPSSAAETATEDPALVYYDISLTHEQQDVVRAVCAEYDVPFDLVLAIMDVESDFDPKAVSKTNDYGAMQINKINHDGLKKALGITDFLDLEQNTKAGCYMLSKLFRKYQSWDMVVQAYHSGETGAKRLWNQGIYSTAYTDAVNDARAALCVSQMKD